MSIRVNHTQLKGNIREGIRREISKVLSGRYRKFSSDTETFVAIRAYIDNWRWAGVPFYLRTGKRLSKQSQITINFIPHNIFPEGKNCKQQTNH